MTAPTADALMLVGVLAVLGTVAIVARKCLRPELSSDWGESVWGDVPEVPSDLFHNGTHTPEARHDHAG